MRAVYLLLFFFPLIASSQVIYGTVTDEKGSPLPNATITMKTVADSSAIKFVLSDKTGQFRLAPVAAGLYRVEASFTGHSTRDTVINLSAADIFLPVWTMTSLAKKLAEVKVTSGRPLIEVQPDKTVFNVAQSIVAAGGNALELLQKSPGVLVDKDDLISMNGKNGVRIYIDGRPSPLSVQEIAALLRTMPSDDVEAIEIITNPSARYEAAGNAGIINIRLKKNKSLGTNGSTNAGWSVGIFPKYTTGINLNHRSKTLNVFGSYSYNKNYNDSYLNLFRFQNDSLYDQRAKTFSEGVAHNVKLGADWFLSREQTLGVLVNGNFSNNRSNTFSSTPIAAQSDKQVAQTLTAFSAGQRNRNNISANLNYRYADTGSRVLSVDADYGYYDVDGKAETQNRYRDRQQNPLQPFVFSNRTPVLIRFYSMQASWEQKWAGGKMNLGWRSASANTDNTFSFFNEKDGQPVFDDSRSNQFEYSESIHAAYAQFNKSKGKWSYHLGLRMEATNSLGELTAKDPVSDQVVKRNYVNLFPSGGFTYQLNPQHQVGLSFSRRIDRPSYQDLNPFENRLDELTYQKGNPFLRPQFTNNIELKHSYKYKLNSSLSFSDVSDFFAAITDTIEGRRNFITQRNIAQQRIYSFNTSLPFRVAAWWNVFASAGINHSRYRAQFEPGKEIHINATVANLYQQHSFSLDKKWSAEISSFWLSPYVWAGTYECRSIWNIDAGIQRKVLNGQGSIKLTVTDIFQRMPWEGVSRLGALRIDAAGGWESRLLRLNFSYRFGNKEVKNARQRNTGLEDLNRRVQ